MTDTAWRRRAAIGLAGAAALAACATPAASAADVRLDFGSAVPGTVADAAGQGTGFTTVLSPRLGTTGIVAANLMLTNAGAESVLAVLATAGDAATAGGSDQDNALAVPVEQGVDFAVQATLVGPLGLTQDGQSAGIHVGLDQIDYLKLVARQSNGAGGLQLRVEEDNRTAAEQLRGVSKIDKDTATRVVLRLEVDADTARVRGLFAVDGGAFVPVATSGAALTTGILTSPGLTAGIISTDPAGGAPWSVRFADFVLDTPPSVESVFPATGTTGVPVDTNVVIAFSDAMAPAGVAPAISLVRASDGARIATTVTLGPDGRTATVDPVVALEAGVGYALAVGTTATDASGYPLRAAVQSAFRTLAPASVAARLPPPSRPGANRRPAATGLRASWNRTTGRLTLRLTGLAGAATVRVGARVRMPKAGVVRVVRRRPGVLVVRAVPKPVAAGLLAPRVWRVALPKAGPPVVRRVSPRP